MTFDRSEVCQIIDDETTVVPVDVFKAAVSCGGFVDDGGYGHPIIDNKVIDDILILSSDLATIPTQATHIMWYNR